MCVCVCGGGGGGGGNYQCYHSNRALGEIKVMVIYNRASD